MPRVRQLGEAEPKMVKAAKEAGFSPVNRRPRCRQPSSSGHVLLFYSPGSGLHISLAFFSQHLNFRRNRRGPCARFYISMISRVWPLLRLLLQPFAVKFAGSFRSAA